MSQTLPPADVPARNTFAADYPSLFGDEGTDRCPDEALESKSGPFAYADALLVVVRRLEATVGTPPQSPLQRRRPDIPNLLLDEPTLNRRVPRLNLVVECLEAMVKSTHGGDGSAASVLVAATSPTNLPFDRGWALVNQALRSKRQHPWQLLRQTDEDYPNFSHATVVNSSMRSALTLSTGLAPGQLRALLAAPIANDSTFWERLGWPAGSTIESVADSATFLKATGLSRKRMRQLLAVNGVAKDGATGTYTSVVVSKEGDPDGQPDSSVFGAHFINGGRSPALRLVSGGAAGRTTRIERLGTEHVQRIDTMLRLHAGTGLPFAALDRLLQAIFGAQGRDRDFQIDVHALRALGLYCHLRDSRRVDLAPYAAVLHEISPYATGRDTPYYEKLFCPGAGDSELSGSGASLTMDGQDFVNASDDPTMQRLCAGLAVGIDTLSVLVKWGTDARKLRAPVRNLSLISTFHRLAVLPRWLGHDEKQGMALLRLFEQAQPRLFALLAGVPTLARDDATGTPDIVDAIVTLMNVSDWLHRHRLDARSLASALANPPVEEDLVGRIPDTSLQAYTVTDDRLRDAFLEMPFARGTNPRPTECLSSLIDSAGLFKDAVFDMDSDTLDMEVELALKPSWDTEAIGSTANTAKFERTRKRVGERLTELLGGQRRLEADILGSLLPDLADPALRACLARWVGASAADVLALLSDRLSPDKGTLAWLQALRQRASLVSLWALDAPTIEMMRSHLERFDLNASDIESPGLILAHRLAEWNTTIRDIATRAGLEEEQARNSLLVYLAEAGETSNRDPATRLAGLLRIDRSVVASVANKVAGATPGNLSTSSHIAWLLRLQALAERTTLSVDALLALARLDPQSGATEIEAAGQLLLATCEPAERDAIVSGHNQAWCAAMVAWLLPRATDTDGRKFTSASELSAWLLIDVEVGPEPETTRLAATIDSLQLYIHRLLSGLEKHLKNEADIKKERKDWSDYRSRYVDWRQNVQRWLYPENLIHPANRQRKTSAFLDLETQLAQGQARPTDIDTTLLRYLADFEQVSNIQVISAYHDGIDPAVDELHLIGRRNIEPHDYFWQSAHMDVTAADDHTGMLAWSGWKKIDLPINGTLTRTRIPKRSAGSVKELEDALKERIDTAEEAKQTARDLMEAVGAAIDKEAAQKAASDAATIARRTVNDVQQARTSLTVALYDKDDSRDSIETIRPLIIDGRKYVVWVERDSTAISFDGEDKVSAYHALRVCYSYLDTNDNWSASNILLNLDGSLTNGERPNPSTTPYPTATPGSAQPPSAITPPVPNLPDRRLFTSTFQPGLIVMENRKGRREADPYLVAMLFDSASDTNLEEAAKCVADKDYFLAVRDLLLVDKKRLDGASKDSPLEKRLVGNWYRLFADPRVVQHPYIGTKYELKAQEGKQTTVFDKVRMGALSDKLIMKETESLGLDAALKDHGKNIEITGSFDDFWLPKLVSRSKVESANDIDLVTIDHVIQIMHVSVVDAPGPDIHEERGVVAECRLRASIPAASWKSDKIYLDSVDVTTTERFLSLRITESTFPNDHSDIRIDNEPLPSVKVKEFTTQDAAIRVIGRLFPKLDIAAKSLTDVGTLQALFELEHIACSPTDQPFYIRAARNYLKIVSPEPEWVPRPIPIPCALGGVLQEQHLFSIKAELIRAGTAQQTSTAASNQDELRHLKADFPALQTDAKERLHALATTDQAALVAWLPLLTDTWYIRGYDYYQALRDEDLEFGGSDDGALSGRLPFLQAMHATNRPSLRDALVGLVADSLGASLPKGTRAKLAPELRTLLVRFAAAEQDSYREFMARLVKRVGGNRGDAVIKTEMLNVHARGTKRIVATIPVDTDETDYTFCVALSSANDPTTATGDDTFFEWVRLTSPYKLTKILEGGAELTDDRVPTSRIRRNRAQAQYLDLDESGLPPIRLNTLFGKQLVARATRSVDAALSIEAQSLPEPALRAGGSGGFVDFRGANGLYFWELFFHVPWLVAWSLSEKGHYAEAWRWCSRYLFDPYRGRTTETTAPIPFWNCLPLVYPLDGARDTGEAPELAGYANAIHFRKAIHAFLVDLWRKEGDEQFRRLTLDTLRDANLCYQKALQLIGTLQEPAEERPWTPATLGSREAAFAFVTPVNRALLDRRALLLSRLDRLRHGRTIDGVLIPYLGYGDEDAENGWGGGRRGSTSGLRTLALHSMPAYRFRTVVAMALAAVERLTDLGRYLFRIYEHEADNALEVERQKNLVALADFDISLKRKAVETARRERNTLQLSQKAVQTRIDYLTWQLASTRSATEIAGTTTAGLGIALQLSRLIPISAQGGLKTIPNIFGMAVGGSKAEGVPQAISDALGASSEASRLLAEDLRVEAAYDRRNEEWTHDKAQAVHDLDILTSQMEEQTSRADSAMIELKEAIMRRETLRNEFQVQTTGFAVSSTYTWMLGRLGDLFASAYQSVFALCMDAEASYRYETGHFDSRHVRLNAWDGARRGMFAGEVLQNDLQAMQEAFLHRHVRRLSIHKTVSLKKLMGGESFDAALRIGKISFNLTQEVFDKDFPGHYLRQIRYVAVALVPKAAVSEPAVPKAAMPEVVTPTPDNPKLGPETEIRAVLTQSSSRLLYRPEPLGVDWLYDPEKGNAEAVIHDLRGDQQLVLSHASPRLSADPMETIALRTEHEDGRYSVFEGTGAISSWTLNFPGDAENIEHLRDRIDDIEIRLDYSAAWGGAEFKEKVDEVLASLPNTKAGTQKLPNSAADVDRPKDTPVDATAYPTPAVKEVRAHNAIDRRDVPHGATVTVSPWRFIRKGQQIWLRCMGTRADGTPLNRALRAPSTPVTEEEVEQGIKATIPLDYLEALGDYSQVRILFKASLDGTGSSSTAKEFPDLLLDIPRCSSLRVQMDKTSELKSLPDPSHQCDYGYVATASEEGPTSLSVKGSTYELKVQAVGSDGNEHTLHCKLSRRLWRADTISIDTKWDSASEAEGRNHENSTTLCAVVQSARNRSLPFGSYQGCTTVQLMGWQTPRVRESIRLELDVTYTAPDPG